MIFFCFKNIYKSLNSNVKRVWPLQIDPLGRLFVVEFFPPLILNEMEFFFHEYFFYELLCLLFFQLLEVVEWQCEKVLGPFPPGRFPP